MTQQEFQKRCGGEIKNGWLVFKGDLDCSYNQLTSLPDNLKVGGHLDCHNNQLTSLPDNLKVVRYLRYLNCSHNKLTSLPDNLRVEGYLDCSNNRLTSLPDNLKVGGELYTRKEYIHSVRIYLPNILKKPRHNHSE